ncbi:hypothetical protein BDR26DRAFT_875531, partial [Obelidium mucronatum]
MNYVRKPYPKEWKKKKKNMYHHPNSNPQAPPSIPSSSSLKPGIIVYPLIYMLDQTQRQVKVLQLNLNNNTPSSILHQSKTAIEALFSMYTVSNPNRLFYAMAGYVFHRNTESPPFGGAIKSNPGYLQFQGTNAIELLEFLVSEAFQAYWGLKGREAVDLVAEAANRVYEMQVQREKDGLDELMMQGMRKAGHIDWVGHYVIPIELRHVNEKKIKRGKECGYDIQEGG